VETPPNAPTPDFAAQQSSDYGSLGPGSDIGLDQRAGSKVPDSAKAKVSFAFNFKLGLPPGAPRTVPSPLPQSIQIIRVVAVLVGMMFAFGIIISKQMTNSHRDENGSQTNNTSRSFTGHRNHYDAAAQREAEQLLARLARNDANAIAQVESRAASWHGLIQFTPQFNQMVAAGLNARDLHARAATIQIDLAAMDVAEEPSSIDRLASQAESKDHSTRIWAIWTLGLLANRGIENGRIVELLTAHLSDKDVESRQWAVEALSYTGSDASIPPLLKTMHNDPSPTVRERAACGLAESGMLSNEQRRTAIPTLLAYAEDPSLDSATHSWTYHALRDITAQPLPDDSAVWRRWYENRSQK
jgi:hypothetical protein